MRFAVVGVSHKTTPVEVRERLALSAEGQERLLAAICDHEAVAEAFVLSTCNRVEVYGVPSGDGDACVTALTHALVEGRGLDATMFEGGYRREGADAVRHLLRVAASLDAMVVGEPQILGQVKEATAQARRVGAIGPILDRLLSRAFQTAKAVRSETTIGQALVSIGSVAVDLARQIFADLGQTRVLLVGAGEMGEVTAQCLAAAGTSRVYIVNRTHERAVELAQTHGWRARQFGELRELLSEVDVVLTSTASQTPILTVALMREVISARKYRPIFLVDIAVPRNVAGEVGELSTVYLYNVDDLEGICSRNLDHRQIEAQTGEAIVDQAVAEVMTWFESLAVAPTIAAIQRRAAEVAAVELQQTFSRRLKALTPEQKEGVEKMTQSLVAKLLHPTMTSLRRLASGGGSTRWVGVARMLHGLDDPAQALEASEPNADEEGTS